MIPIVMLLEVKKDTTEAIGQVLAMVKGIDHINLKNGYDLPFYCCVITTLKLWKFLLVTTDGGYKVYESEELFWGPLGKQVNGTILSYLRHWFHKAAKMVTEISKVMYKEF